MRPSSMHPTILNSLYFKNAHKIPKAEAEDLLALLLFKIQTEELPSHMVAVEALEQLVAMALVEDRDSAEAEAKVPMP